MSTGVAARILVVLSVAAMCAAMTGCSLSLPGQWFGADEGRQEGEPAKQREVLSAPSPAEEAPVSPDVIMERPIGVSEAPAEAGGPEAATKDYRVITSFSDLGVVEIVLQGRGLAPGAWRSADAEARKRCRAWGYEQAVGNLPVERVRLYRCQGKVAAPGDGHRNQAALTLWRTAEFRQVLWNFRGRAEQGDRQALAIVQGMAANQGDLERRADRGGAKAWTHWKFSTLMASDGEVRGETWRCIASGRRASGAPEVMLGRLEEAGADLGVGEVSSSGVSHPAVFRASGPALRWEYGSGPWRELPRGFVIEPDGSGYQLDVSSPGNAEPKPPRAFDCRIMY
ncbi:MAG: hypothetical protein OXP66_01980 [Candidatus Tectomicrobia bacterium]|nr:hypothetical protein [Candidatus Tectomicrobia bacterium]